MFEKIKQKREEKRRLQEAERKRALEEEMRECKATAKYWARHIYSKLNTSYNSFFDIGCKRFIKFARKDGGVLWIDVVPDKYSHYSPSAIPDHAEGGWKTDYRGGILPLMKQVEFELLALNKTLNLRLQTPQSEHVESEDYSGEIEHYTCDYGVIFVD